MTRQHLLLSAFILLLAAPAAAYDEHQTTSVSRPPTSDLRLNIDFSEVYYDAPESSFVDSVTMRTLPAGSMVFEYRGVHRLAIRQARSQYRRAVKTAVRRGWYVRPESDDFEPLFRADTERDFAGHHVNGAWWTRSWMDSLPSEKGGAPDDPYVHVFGAKTELDLGLLRISNELNVKLNYISFLELNPNPVDQDQRSLGRRPTIAVDVKPLGDEPRTGGTDVKFAMRPRFRVGAPTGGSWLEVLKGISLRGLVEIRSRGKKIIEGEVAIKWEPDDGLVMTFDLSLASW